MGIRPGPIAFAPEGRLDVHPAELGDRNSDQNRRAQRGPCRHDPARPADTDRDRRRLRRRLGRPRRAWVVLCRPSFNRVVTIDTIQAGAERQSRRRCRTRGRVWAAYADSSLVQVDQDVSAYRREAFRLGAAPCASSSAMARCGSRTRSAPMLELQPETSEEGVVRTISVCEQPAAIRIRRRRGRGRLRGGRLRTRTPATVLRRSRLLSAMGRSAVAARRGSSTGWKHCEREPSPGPTRCT